VTTPGYKKIGKIFENFILVDPPCLCLQKVVSEVQRNESENHAHFGGYSLKLECWPRKPSSKEWMLDVENW